MLLINLGLAFFEHPSSFSVTSDVRDKPHRIVFPYFLLMTIECLTLLWLCLYICMKVKNSNLTYSCEFITSDLADLSEY